MVKVSRLPRIGLGQRTRVIEIRLLLSYTTCVLLMSSLFAVPPLWAQHLPAADAISLLFSPRRPAPRPLPSGASGWAFRGWAPAVQ